MRCERWLCGNDATKYIKIEIPVATNFATRMQEDEAWLCDKHIRNTTRNTKRKGGRVLELKTLAEKGF